MLAALDEIGRIVDRGIDEVIDALGSLKEACESEGGPIPGLDLSIAASVDVGGGFGLRVVGPAAAGRAVTRGEATSGEAHR